LDDVNFGSKDRKDLKIVEKSLKEQVKQVIKDDLTEAMKLKIMRIVDKHLSI